jgi:hypothetical protein
MLKQILYMRFTITGGNDMHSSLKYYWYVLENSSIVPRSNENDDKNKRPDYIQT